MEEQRTQFRLSGGSADGNAANQIPSTEHWPLSFLSEFGERRDVYVSDAAERAN